MLRAHRPLDRLLLLGRERDGGAAAVELLDVDPRVVSPLDGAQDDAAPRGVEQGDRSGLVVAGLLVGVVADDGQPRHGRVDASLEPPERGRDLVERAVQPVDPPLKGDGEVDEVTAAAALQRELRGPHPAQPKVDHKCDREADHGDDRRPDRDPPCHRSSHWCRSTELSRGEAEEDRIRGSVVREVLLAADLAHLDAHGGLLAEGRRREVEAREGDGRRLALVDRRDLLRLGEHRLLEDAHLERHGNPHFPELPAVRERDLEGEVRGDIHRRRAGDRQRLRLAARGGLGADELTAVSTGHLPSRARGAQSRVDLLEGIGADHHGVRDDLRRWGDHVQHALPPQGLRRRQPEEIRPYEVARAQHLGLLGEELADVGGVLRSRSGEHVGETGKPDRAQLERRQHLLVRRLQRPGRHQAQRLVVVLLLLPRPQRELRLELGERELRRVQLPRERGRPGGGRALRDRLHLVHVRLVLVVLALALARADPEDEADDDCDGQRHEPGQARESDGSRRRRGRPPRPAAALRPDPPPRPAGRLERRRLLEELEIVLVVKGAHDRANPTAPGRTVREGQSDRVANLRSCMGEAAPALTGIELVLTPSRPLRPLASGGSGSVWLARDERTGLDVALKIVAREGKSAMRAEREGKAAAHLRHPACLRASGFGRDSRHVYIAYEYVPGQTYREALRAGALTDDDAVEACAQVCDGLAHAHAAGILHRDVKPSNVLLMDGDRVAARVLDFGLAQMADGAETLTEAGDVPGTLAYISPERLAGGEATQAADVWAVGVMLWEAFAGRHPFWRGSMLETARAIEAGARPLAEFPPDLPKPLLRVVDGALAKNPARRPTARELADALRGAATTAIPRPGFKLPTRIEPGQAVTAVLAALLAGWTSSALPFYPPSWPVLLALVALATTLLRERAGIALALAVPVLPLGNISLGLAVLYAALAAGWLLVTWREPRAALLFVIGPLLAPCAALGLLPLAVARVRSAPLRMLTVALGVLTASLAAGIRQVALPLVGGPAPLGLGVAGARDPFDVAGSLARAAGAHPALLLETCALALVALALPHARARGRWAAAGLGAGMIVLTVAAVPSAAALPLLFAAWTIAAVTALRAPALGVPSAAS